MKVNKKPLAPVPYKEIEIREATVGENIEAARIAGEERGLKFVCALLAITATFDGKKLQMEDILNFPESFFLELLQSNVELPIKELKEQKD